MKRGRRRRWGRLSVSAERWGPGWGVGSRRECAGGGAAGLQGTWKLVWAMGQHRDSRHSLSHLTEVSLIFCKPRLGSDQQDTVGIWSTGPRGLQASHAAPDQENHLTTQALLFLTHKTEIMPLKLQGHFDPCLRIKREAL